MADEIRFSCELSVTNGSLTASQSVSDQADQTTPGTIQLVQNIGTTAEDVLFTGLTAPRWMILQNLDATNYVDIGMSDGGTLKALIQLKAGESCKFPLKPSTTVRAQANTAAIDLAIMAAET